MIIKNLERTARDLNYLRKRDFVLSEKKLTQICLVTVIFSFSLIIFYLAHKEKRNSIYNLITPLLVTTNRES